MADIGFDFIISESIAQCKQHFILENRGACPLHGIHQLRPKVLVPYHLNRVQAHGPLTRCVKLRVVRAPGMPGTFSPPPRISDPDMHHGTCATHVPWCTWGSLIKGFLWSRWRGKRYRHFLRMRDFTYLVRGPWGTGYLRRNSHQGQLLLTWNNCNRSMDK